MQRTSSNFCMLVTGVKGHLHVNLSIVNQKGPERVQQRRGDVLVFLFIIKSKFCCYRRQQGSHKILVCIQHRCCESENGHSIISPERRQFSERFRTCTSWIHLCSEMQPCIDHRACIKAHAAFPEPTQLTTVGLHDDITLWYAADIIQETWAKPCWLSTRIEPNLGPELSANHLPAEACLRKYLSCPFLCFQKMAFLFYLSRRCCHRSDTALSCPCFCAALYPARLLPTGLGSTLPDLIKSRD